MAFSQIPITTPSAAGAADLINCRRNLQAGLDQLRMIRQKMATQFDGADATQVATHFGVATANAQALNDITAGLLTDVEALLVAWLARIG